MEANNFVTVKIDEVLTPQEVVFLDSKIDQVIQQSQQNRKDVNRLTFECIAALGKSEEAQQKLQNKGFLSRIIGSITGSNQKLANAGGAQLVTAQYASQKILQRMAEQNVLSFDLLKAVNNKMDASLGEVDRRFEDLYEGLRNFVKYNQSQVVQLSLRIDKVERNVALLNWQASVEYRMYQGREYIDLTPVEKLVCTARDFYDITKGNWNTGELLLLKSAMGAIGLDAREKINYLTLVQHLNEDKALKDYLLGDGDIVIDQAEPEYLLCFGALNKLKKLDGDESYLLATLSEVTGVTDTEKLKETVLLNYMKKQAQVDLNTEVTYYDLLLDLLFNLDQCAEESPLIANSEASMDKIYMGQAFDLETGIKDCQSLGYDWYLQAAERGDARAQNALAICYEYGLGTTQDYQKAVSWFRKAADKGLPDAMVNLGLCYDSVKGVREDKEKAVELYKKASEAGYVRAQIKLGECYLMGRGVKRDEGKAVDLFRAVAEHGYAAAEYYLAMCYEMGIGVEQNETRAVEWYKKAAEQDDADAQNNLGDCYLNGVGVGVDEAQAVEWYRKAAQQGNKLAQYALGDCYLNGDGVESDEERAVVWYKVAAEQGYARAQDRLGLSYLDGVGIETDEAQAVEWFWKAAQQGYANAQNNLGDCYFKGVGVEKNEAQAVEWYRKAVEQEHTRAMIRLGMCYGMGRGVDRDVAIAVELFKQAERQGANDVQVLIGISYLVGGKGLAKNEAMAVEWFRKAAAGGDEDAIKQLNKLGYSY
ncbi:SEL1-like repeat protein [uncultured Megasphaera sp.]|uniref:SEL1-like repeat protein n=1 Tax=uncultured Megasphaera sp. TaxID=165188 RepID=UPI0025F3DD78|nr:tetratricopeptide repeat protein [uncultured Megasphaera sp.]